MKLTVQIRGQDRTVEIARAPGPGMGRLRVTIDGRPVEADAVEVAAGTYSILLGNQAFEVRVRPGLEGLVVQTAGEEFAVAVVDPRDWSGKRGHGGTEAEGRQQVTAPMPGKIVRVLVKAGDAVEVGQGLLVVEAMKMQNELRAPKSGKVEKLLVSEGQAVNSGETLAIVA